MAITANAWVSPTGSASITFWSAEGWTDPSWRLSGSAGDFPSDTYVSLYSLWTQSGVGEINGSFLKIFLHACPNGSFQIETQHGTKRFMLSEGKLVLGADVVGVNDVNLNFFEAGSKISTTVNGIVYFGGSLDSFKGRMKAQLQIAGEVHATVGGNAVESITDTTTEYRGNWAIPAAIFTDFYWKHVPSGPTVYDFVFREEKRTGSGGATLSFPIEMDTTRIYSPLATSTYPVRSSDQFTISLSTGLEVRY